MANHGEKLNAIAIEDITQRLAEESDGKAIKRLVAAREYLDGNSPAEIEEKYGWPEQTIYSWFDRLEARDFDEALRDESPPGRPPALSEAEFRTFRNAVSNPPGAVGVDASAWSPALAQAYLRSEFDLDFSQRHVRRLMNEAAIP